MRAKIGDVSITIYSYDYDEAGHLFCICRIPGINRKIPVLAALIDVC